MKMNTGIYKITNITNDHSYVGSAINIANRWGRHRSDLRTGVHCNPYLQRAWDKHGEADFEFKIIGTCASEDLIRLEQEVMDHLKPEYNINPTAGSRLGTKHSPETITRIGASHKGMSGRRHSVETRVKMSVANRGQKRSPETCANISASKKGQKYSPEHRANISAAMKASWGRRV